MDASREGDGEQLGSSYCFCLLVVCTFFFVRLVKVAGKNLQWELKYNT